MHEQRRQQQTNPEVSGSRLLITIALNLVITVFQVAGGILSGSLALLSDALHNFSDVVAVASSYFAWRIGLRDSTDRKTFGFKRVEILVALLNASILIIISFFLFREAVARLLEPQAVDGVVMMVVAGVGLIANSIGVWLLKRDSTKSINIRTAYLHLLTDAMTSVAVVIGGLLIHFWGILWVDSVFTFLIGMYVLKGGYRVMKEALDILMESVPAHIDIDHIKRAVEDYDDVVNIHHIHVWRTGDRDVLLEGHVDLAGDMTVSQASRLIQDLEKMLRERFGITHVTLQMEYDICTEKDTFCR